MTVEEKRKKEQKTVEEMIRLYCKGVHKSRELCPECQELLNYAKSRSENCPFMETKTFCSHCKVHCYKADMREKIRKVMRYSGPRMIFHHPFLVLFHMYYSMKEKRESERET